MQKKVLVSSFIIGILATSGISLSALAYQGNPGQFGPNRMAANHEQIEQALANNDYAAWQTLMAGRGRVSEIITADNFARFAEMHKLMEEGKYAEANQIREELGLGLGRQSGNWHGRNSGGNFVDKNKDGICDRRQ